MLFHISGSWSTIAKLEASLPTLAKQHNFTVQIKRTNPRPETSALPYQAQIVAKDRPGILNDLALFFSQQGIAIDKMESETYLAKNNTAMTNIQFVVEIPAKQQIANVRERFMIYCEDRNLDAVIEPHK